jgi:hypothetical protein
LPWNAAFGHLTDELLARLAQCRLMRQPYKIVYEPRKVRRRPQVYPALNGDRKVARQQTLRDHGWEDDPATDHPDPSAPAAVLVNMTQQHASQHSALAGGMPAGAAADCQASLIRLLNSEKIIQISSVAAARCIECTLRLAADSNAPDLICQVRRSFASA